MFPISTCYGRPALAIVPLMAAIAIVWTGLAPAWAQPIPSVTASHTSDANFSVRHYEATGNTVLGQAELDRVLQPATGSNINILQVRQALVALQEAYRERGYTRAAVRLPRQRLADGMVVLSIVEGPGPETHSEPTPATVAALSKSAISKVATPPSVRTFEVRRYEVLGNTLLKPAVIDQVFSNATGSAVSLPQIQRALGDLQLAYRERGYATVSVGLPQQQLTNATVKVQVTEGLLTDLQVTGQRYFSSNNVRRALPSLRTNTIVNSRVFQRELDLANQNRDRQIYPTLSPGPDPGSSALDLQVKDRLPLHGRIEVNNQASPGTPEWRLNASAQYNNLWQREHQLGLSYGFTPEAFKAGDVVPDYFFNRPPIAYYGAYYRLPFGGAESLTETLQNSARFGYDEATRQFRLPPVGARPDVTLFASASSSDTGVKYGPANIVSQTPILSIVSQDTGQNVSINESVGGRLNLPLPLTDRRRFVFSAGPDVKRYFLASFNTNNFIITTVVTNAQGSQTLENRVASPQPQRRNEVVYLPLSFGMDYSQSDPGGTFSASLGLSGNFLGDASDFAPLAYSPKAKAEFGKVTLGLTRDQKVFKDWSLLLRANGQAATGPLLSTEQFALGGLNSVRGYFEGDEYGDAGWFSSIEARTPFFTLRAPTGASFVPVWLRGSVFVDAGQRFLMDTSATSQSHRTFLGTGFGLSANLDNRLDLRIAVGWPWLDSANTTAGTPRAHFSLGGQF